VFLGIIIVGWYLYRGMAQPTGPSGKLYMSISDASADIQSVNDIAMTVNKVELRNSAGAWVTVSKTPKTVNLLTLKANGKAELAASADVAADTYDQVRASVSKVDVKTKSGTKAAVLVSKTFTAPAKTVVRANEETHVDLDVEASNSLHTAAGGEFVFAPVILVTSRSGADVTVSSDNNVTASGGTLDASITVGTDISGETRVNARLSPNATLEIKGGVPVLINASGSAAGASSGLIDIRTGAVINVGGSASGSATTSNSGASGGGSTIINVGAEGSGSINLY